MARRRTDGLGAVANVVDQTRTPKSFGEVGELRSLQEEKRLTGIDDQTIKAT